MQTVKVDGESYRITSSTMGANDEAIRHAFKMLGISDHVNALPPRAKVRHEQLLIWADGTVTKADDRITSIAARMCSPRITERGLAALLCEFGNLTF